MYVYVCMYVCMYVCIYVYGDHYIVIIINIVLLLQRLMSAIQHLYNVTQYVKTLQSAHLRVHVLRGTNQ